MAVVWGMMPSTAVRYVAPGGDIPRVRRLTLKQFQCFGIAVFVVQRHEDAEEDFHKRQIW